MGKQILVDLSTVMKPHKPYADSTLNNMRKSELIEYVRMCERNYDIAVASLNQQADNMIKITEGWKPVLRSAWHQTDYHDFHCLNCGELVHKPTKFCPNCGANMNPKESVSHGNLHL